MLPDDDASTFKPVAPEMKSTLAKYAHKSMTSLLNTSPLNVYDKDEQITRFPATVAYFEAQHSSQEENYLPMSERNHRVEKGQQDI